MLCCSLNERNHSSSSKSWFQCSWSPVSVSCLWQEGGVIDWMMCKHSTFLWVCHTRIKVQSHGRKAWLSVALSVLRGTVRNFLPWLIPFLKECRIWIVFVFVWINMGVWGLSFGLRLVCVPGVCIWNVWRCVSSDVSGCWDKTNTREWEEGACMLWTSGILFS